jgi:hypothetical protein
MGAGIGCVLVMLIVLVYGCGLVFSGSLPSERTSNVITSCAHVRPILEMKNLSTDIPEQPVNGKKMCSLLWILTFTNININKCKCLFFFLSITLFTCLQNIIVWAKIILPLRYCVLTSLSHISVLEFLRPVWKIIQLLLQMKYQFAYLVGKILCIPLYKQMK